MSNHATYLSVSKSPYFGDIPASGLVDGMAKKFGIKPDEVRQIISLGIQWSYDVSKEEVAKIVTGKGL